MKINDKYSLESDNLNVVLMETRVITGEGRGRKSTKAIGSKYSTPVAYFSTTGEPLQNALHYIANHEIFGDGLKDLETITKKSNRRFTFLSNQLKPH